MDKKADDDKSAVKVAKPRKVDDRIPVDPTMSRDQSENMIDPAENMDFD